MNGQHRKDENEEFSMVNVPRGAVCAPVPGRIERIEAKDYAWVKSGDVLLILKAMGMMIPVVAQQDGFFHQRVQAGNDVDKGEVLATIEEDFQSIMRE